MKGFTLIGILIAVVLLGLGILGLLGANVTVQQWTEGTFERSLAVQDAGRVIEEMRNTANQSLLNQFQPEVINRANAVSATIRSLPTVAGEQINVAFANPAGDPLDATVTVNWIERGTRSKSVALRTFITKRS